MDNLETVSINLEEEYNNFLDNENTPASKEVREASRLHDEAVDHYISAVVKDSWKHGFSMLSH